MRPCHGQEPLRGRELGVSLQAGRARWRALKRCRSATADDPRPALRARSRTPIYSPLHWPCRERRAHDLRDSRASVSQPLADQPRAGRCAAGVAQPRFPRALRSLPRLRHRRCCRAERARTGAARRLDAPGVLVLRPGACSSTGSTRCSLMDGPTARAAARSPASIVCGCRRRAATSRPTRRPASTPIRSRASCRSSSRPRASAACNGSRRTSCTMRTRSTRRALPSTSRRCGSGSRRGASRTIATVTGDAAMMIDALVYLAAAVLCVPLARRLGLGAVLGYLIAGVAIGPWGLRLVDDVESILHFSEFGVVLMLFVIGLELEAQRLWAMRGSVFGGGALQLALSGAALAAGGLAMGLPLQAAIVAGLALALSSTAIAMQSMSERNLTPTPMGRDGVRRPAVPGHRRHSTAGGDSAARGACGAGRNAGLAAGRESRGRGGRRPGDRSLPDAPGAAHRRRHQHPRGVHRVRAAAGHRHRAIDEPGRNLDGARRLPCRRAARELGIPPCARDRHRAVQGTAAGPLLHLRRDDGGFRPAAERAAGDRRARRRTAAAEARDAVAGRASHGRRLAAALALRRAAGAGRRVRIRRVRRREAGGACSRPTRRGS